MSGLGDALAVLLAVPGRPEPPPGAAGTVRVFRAARRYYRYLLLRWVGRQGWAALGLVAGLGALQAVPDFSHRGLLDLLEAVGVAGFLLQLPFTLLLVKLDYDYRWYVVTDRSLRIREGVLTVREQTLGFANVQNVSIRRGPLQQLLGIADLEVRTAGGAGAKGGDDEDGKGDPHSGVLRGVEDPEEIRELILARLRRLRDSGLGDPDEVAGETAREEDEPLAAARELLAAARAQRRALVGREAAG